MSIYRKPICRYVRALGCWVCGYPSSANSVGLWPCGHGATWGDAFVMWRNGMGYV